MLVGTSKGRTTGQREWYFFKTELQGRHVLHILTGIYSHNAECALHLLLHVANWLTLPDSGLSVEPFD